MTENHAYQFSFGPWNVHQGAEPFGPPVRSIMSMPDILDAAVKLGFSHIQLHDDDVVRGLAGRSMRDIADTVAERRRQLDDRGLKAEFVAPRLWEDGMYSGGAYTNTDQKVRQRAIERSKLAIDIAGGLRTNLIVLWLAREGAIIPGTMDTGAALGWLIEAIDAMLDHNDQILIAIEPKPNEPGSQALIPSVGDALWLATLTCDPDRVGINVESAHSVLAGRDPAQDMEKAIYADKLLTVHINGQDGEKFDQDLSFDAVNPLRGLHQAMVLEGAEYWRTGVVGIDAKAVRTQRESLEDRVAHLKDSMEMFKRYVEIARSLDGAHIAELRRANQVQELSSYVIRRLIGMR